MSYQTKFIEQEEQDETKNDDHKSKLVRPCTRISQFFCPSTQSLILHCALLFLAFSAFSPASCVPIQFHYDFLS
jgi:hypothetical protein